MRTVYIDTETANLQEGIQAPPLATVQFYDPARNEWGICDHVQGCARFKDYLRDDDVRIVGHNFAQFDEPVFAAEDASLLPLLFAAHDRGRIEDSLITEQLIDIAEGHFRWDVSDSDEGEVVIKKKGYGLGDLVPGLEKKGDVRTSFGVYRGRIDALSEAQRQYALKDVFATAWLDQQQQSRWPDLPDRKNQAAYGFSLGLTSAWGMRTDPEAVAHLRFDLEQQYVFYSETLKRRGFIRPTGSKSMQIIRDAIQASGARAMYTKGGAVSTSKEALELAAEFDPDLHVLAEFNETEKLLSTYVPALERGTRVPLNPSFQTLVETGRTSCRNPNLQNLPRGKKKDGKWVGHAHRVRECFIPRAGNLFCSTDYDALEVRTFGQVLKEMVGGRTLVDAFAKDPSFDPHVSFAALELGIPYDVAKLRYKAKDPLLVERRQMMKAFVFGAPGGMGARKMVEYAWKSYGVRLSVERSKQLMAAYRRWLPEVNRYYDMAAMATSGGRVATVRQITSGRIRGGCRYTDWCNGNFQGLAADGAKLAHYEQARACYVTTSSPMYGCRLVNFVHDESIMECRREIAHEAATEQQRIMTETMHNYFTPDIPSKASPALMGRWYKGADAVYDAQGRLQEWIPKP